MSKVFIAAMADDFDEAKSGPLIRFLNRQHNPVSDLSEFGLCGPLILTKNGAFNWTSERGFDYYVPSSL